MSDRKSGPPGNRVPGVYFRFHAVPGELRRNWWNRLSAMGSAKRSLLLDGNLLVALRIDTHEHHELAQEWFASLPGEARFVTCSVTEGTLLRVHMAVAFDRSAEAAWEALLEIRHHRQHQFWNSGFSYTEVECRGLTGGKQVTDAWLAELARRKNGKLMTLDAGLAAVHADVALLVQ